MGDDVHDAEDKQSGKKQPETGPSSRMMPILEAKVLSLEDQMRPDSTFRGEARRKIIHETGLE